MTALAHEATSEGRIFNEVVTLLDRQRNEPIDGPLRELDAQLTSIYNGSARNVDYGTCQMGLSLIKFGLGDHKEASRLATNALKIAAFEEHVTANAMVLRANMGELDAARETALEGLNRFSSVATVLRQVVNVLADTLDFGASVAAIDLWLRLAPEQELRASLLSQQALYRQLAQIAEGMSLGPDDLRARAQCAADELKRLGHNIYWLDLHGTGVESVSLDFHVDASPEECAELNFSIADALIERFDDTAMGVVSMSVRSFVGAQRLEAVDH